MKRTLSLSLLTAALALAQKPTNSLADLPDPLVGTDSKFELSRGNTYPATFLPFAMANWTPQTGEGGWPYAYAADSIRGFRSTHRPSAWMTDYGPFALMPVVGELRVLPEKRAAKFKHSNEDARAWRYTVKFDEAGLAAGMAPTRHAGVMRFSFPETDKAWVVLDAMPGGSEVKIDAAARTVRGKNMSSNRRTAKNFALYFVAVFDKPFTAQGTFEGKTGETDKNLERAGAHAGAYLGFTTKANEAVTVRIGTSLISYEQAELNLKTEIGAAGFDEIAARAKAEWEKSLSIIQVSGGTADQRKTFYTSLYHALQFPRMLDERDAAGKQIHYSPYDGKIHDGPLFSDTGFWDTYRAEFPFLALVHPSRVEEIIRAMLIIYDHSGWIPKWPNPAETNVMIGTHADSVIADAYMKGLRNFDAEKAYAAIRKDATLPGTGIFEARGGIESYIKLGYVPADIKVKESAARTLEYAYDDFCVAQMAKALGKTDDYRLFTAQSMNYKNIFDAKTGFMRGKNSDGKFIEPFSPIAWGGVYTEGNAWQWLWSVQHDVPGLVALLGGREKFIAKMDEMFTMSPDFEVGGYGGLIHEMTEAKLANTGQYAHINEPCHHVLYLYNAVGQPWKTQKWTRDIMERLYKPGPSGWLGDEDNGQTSAWYLFSALGFYPVNPGQPVYSITSPIFDKATVKLENGKSFTVETARKSGSDLYIQSATLNGKPLTRAWITHSEILAGGTLKFTLGAKPSETWGVGGLPTADETFPKTK